MSEIVEKFELSQDAYGWKDEMLELATNDAAVKKVNETVEELNKEIRFLVGLEDSLERIGSSMDNVSVDDLKQIADENDVDLTAIERVEQKELEIIVTSIPEGLSIEEEVEFLNEETNIDEERVTALKVVAEDDSSVDSIREGIEKELGL